MLLVQMVNYAFPIITIPIVSRVFGPEKIGFINYITAIVAYFTLMVSYSFNFTGVRRVTADFSKKDKVFRTIFTTQSILLLVCAFIFIFVVLVQKDLKDNFILAVVIFTSCVTALFTQNWFLQANSDFKFLAKISFSSKLLSFILIIFLIKGGSSLLVYAAIINFIPLIVSVVVFVITIRRYRIKLYPARIGDCISYLKEDSYLFLSSIVTSLYTTSGIILLGYLSSKSEVGYYTSAQRVIDTFKSIIMLPISQIVFPILSEKFSKNINEGMATVRKIMPIFILISLSTLVFIYVFSGLIVGVLFGPEFTPVIQMLSILSLGLFFVFFGTLIGGQVMLNLKLDKQFLWIQVIVSCLSLVFNFLFIHKGGGVVTATVWTICEGIITLYQVLYLRCKGITVLTISMLSPSEIKRSLLYVFKRNTK